MCSVVWHYVTRLRFHGIVLCDYQYWNHLCTGHYSRILLLQDGFYSRFRIIMFQLLHSFHRCNCYESSRHSLHRSGIHNLHSVHIQVVLQNSRSCLHSTQGIIHSHHTYLSDRMHFHSPDTDAHTSHHLQYRILYSHSLRFRHYPDSNICKDHSNL